MNYIGSKHSIIDFISDTVDKFIKPKKNMIFCDIFSGTSNVGKFFKEKGYKVISNDIQYYSYILSYHYIKNNNEYKFKNLDNINPFDYLNNISLNEGFIFNNYTNGGAKNKEIKRMYFTDENGKKIDSIRIQIENWKNTNKIDDDEYYYLIACLIEAADKVANTASVYEAFLKSIKKSAEKKLVIEPLKVIFSKNKNEVYNSDSNELIKNISGDILYMDPPYNNRKYDTNYHILETIALYDNPDIKGKTGVRCESTKRSLYCNKGTAKQAFEDMIKEAKFKYILLSYNDEGIISIEDIEKIMSKYGKYKRYEKKHRRFKSDNNRNNLKDYTIEYIHCLEKK